MGCCSSQDAEVTLNFENDGTFHHSAYDDVYHPDSAGFNSPATDHYHINNDNQKSPKIEQDKNETLVIGYIRQQHSELFASNCQYTLFTNVPEGICQLCIGYCINRIPKKIFLQPNTGKICILWSTAFPIRL